MFQVLTTDVLIIPDHAVLHRLVGYERDAQPSSSCAVQANYIQDFILETVEVKLHYGVHILPGDSNLGEVRLVVWMWKVNLSHYSRYTWPSFCELVPGKENRTMFRVFLQSPPFNVN